MNRRHKAPPLPRRPAHYLGSRAKCRPALICGLTRITDWTHIPARAMQRCVRQCARVLRGKKRSDVPVPAGSGLYRLPKIGKLQKLGNWGCGRRPTGMLQFLSSQQLSICYRREFIKMITKKRMLISQKGSKFVDNQNDTKQHNHHFINIYFMFITNGRLDQENKP